MKNRKTYRLAAAAGLAVILLVGGTLAYFTDHDNAVRLFVLGHVNISLTEDMTDPDNPDGERIPYEDPTNVIPGDVISKRPLITVEKGSADCYLRVLLTITSPEGADPAVTADNLNIDKSRWFVAQAGENQWYCYYTGGSETDILSPGDQVFVFDEVEVPGQWEEEVYSSQIVIDVKAEAIQSENFTPAVKKDDTGVILSYDWQDTKGQQIETEVYKGK